MNKLKPRNKICFQNHNNKPAYLKIKNLKKLQKRKWIFIKKKINYKYKTNKKIKPEKRKNFFQKRLFEKQQFKNFYGCLSEYKLKNIKKKFKNNNNIKNFIPIFESRLDINLLRLKKAKTIFQAQQLINHKKVKINNKIINQSNFSLKPGDIIIVKKKDATKKKKRKKKENS